VRNTLYSYLQLTKPRIVLLFTLTGIAALVLEGTLAASSVAFWMIVLGMTLTAGSANALNQYIDRDIDAVMERTRKKRPLPMGLITPNHALAYALVSGVVATWILYFYGNAHAAFWGVFTIGFYVGVYTLWLKRRTPYNIVIGGAAGATAPLIGWAAGTGQLSWIAVAMFMVIFMWTPPHFWALALCVKDEYAEASVPMLPVVAGESRTRLEILIYTIALLPFTLVPYALGGSGNIYLISAILLGAEFLRRAWALYTLKDRKTAWGLFGYSIVYLLALYVVMILDRWLS
jgi:protoheme IX farnesyltransferase